MNQAVRRRSLTAEARVLSYVTSMRFVVDIVAFGQDFLEYFGFLLSLPFHQRSTLIFIYVSLFLEGQTNEARKCSKKCFGNREEFDIKLL
jgi:hypothetical protein